MRILQVALSGPRTQLTTSQIYSPYVVFQNNTGSAIRIGDNTTTTTKGISIAANGSLIVQRADNRIPLFSYFASGAGSLDVLYE